MLHQSNIVVPVNVDYELSGPIHAIVGDARKDSVLSMFDAAGLDLDISVSRIPNESHINGPALCPEPAQTPFVQRELFANCVENNVPREIIVGQPTYLAITIDPADGNYNSFPMMPQHGGLLLTLLGTYYARRKPRRYCVCGFSEWQ